MHLVCLFLEVVRRGKYRRVKTLHAEFTSERVEIMMLLVNSSMSFQSWWNIINDRFL